MTSPQFQFYKTKYSASNNNPFSRATDSSESINDQQISFYLEFQKITYLIGNPTMNCSNYIHIWNVKEYQKVVDAEWQILCNKLQKICNLSSETNVVLSRLPIGDVPTQWFTDRNMFCVSPVIEYDIKRTLWWYCYAIQNAYVVTGG